jgi:hypothetical protein
MSIRTVSQCVVVMLGCGLACFAPDPELPEVEVAAEPEPELGEAAADEEFRATYSCPGDVEFYGFTSEWVGPQGFEGDDVDPFYCLTRCEGHYDMSRANKQKVEDPSKRTDSWCLSYAASFCSKLNRELESWCWGIREEDDD